MDGQTLDKLKAILAAVESGDNSVLIGLDERSRDELAGLLHEVEKFDPQQKKWVARILKQLPKKAKPPEYTALLAKDWIRKPVDIEQFVTDPDYLGFFGPSLYPEWLKELKYVFDPKNKVFEVCLTGAIGIGKNTVASVAMAYMLYRLSCLADPCAYYGLMPKSPIGVGIYSVTLKKAETVGYGHLRAFVEASPYFKSVFPKNPKKKTELIFPNHISVIHGSQALHALGENLICVQLDEMNFMRGEGNKAQAYNLYTGCRRRMVSRFLNEGRVPGLLILISSRRATADFMEQHIEKHGRDPGVHVSDFALWEVKKTRYSGKTFRVFVGDKFHTSRIMSEDEAPSDPDLVMDVPAEHRSDFEADIDGSLRDIAGIATSSISPLLRDKESLYACLSDNRRHPFKKPEFSISHLTKEEIGDYFDADLMLTTQHSVKRPKVRPERPRFIHIDLARTGDAAGICMGHVSGVERRESRLVSGVMFPELIPHVYIDFLLRIIPPPSGEIDFAKIRRFILQLKEFGFFIGGVSFDAYQSADSVQLLQSAGIKAKIVSIDRNDTAYIYTRQGIIERRINAYRYPILETEFSHLEHNKVKRKVDHPKEMVDENGVRIKGSKDCSDALAGVVIACMESVAQGGHISSFEDTSEENSELLAAVTSGKSVKHGDKQSELLSFVKGILTPGGGGFDPFK